MPTLDLGQVRPVARGQWTDADNYSAYDWVTHTGSAWLALQDVPANYEPGSHPEFWTLFGAKGDKGDKGTTGPMGPQGPAGANGRDGKDGAQGPQGVQGLQGPVGPQGPKGEQGPQGPAVPLSNSVSSTSQTDAASSLAVKTAYDRAAEAEKAAEAAREAIVPPDGTTIATVNGKLAVPVASDTKRGILRTATTAEVLAGAASTNLPAAVTPEGLTQAAQAKNCFWVIASVNQYFSGAGVITQVIFGSALYTDLPGWNSVSHKFICPRNGLMLFVFGVDLRSNTSGGRNLYLVADGAPTSYAGHAMTVNGVGGGTLATVVEVKKGMPVYCQIQPAAADDYLYGAHGTYFCGAYL